MQHFSCAPEPSLPNFRAMTNRYRFGLGRRRISPGESDCDPKAEPESRPTRAMRRVNARPAAIYIRPRSAPSCRCCHIRLGCLQLSGFSFSHSCICVHCFWPHLSGLTFLNLTFLMCSTVVEHSRDTACTKIDSCFREFEYFNSSDLRSRSDHTSTIRR